MPQLRKNFAALAVRPLVAAGLAAPVWLTWRSDRPFSGGMLAAVVATSVMLLLLSYVASRRVSRTGESADRVLILGTAPQAYALAAEISARPAGRYVVVGLVEESRNTAGTNDSIMRLGTMDALEEIISEVQPARIAMALRSGRRAPEDVLLEARMRGVAVEEATTLFESLAGKLAIELLKPRSLFLSTGFRHSDSVSHADWSQTITRAMNVVGAALGLVVLAPLYALVALAIFLESGGPVFFVQERIGRGGRPFHLIKFRSMRLTGATASEWVRDNAGRITRVGRILRKVRLDELPQLWNVFRGEMNLVGPRPHPVSNHAQFLAHIPYYGLRATVRPGLTGWAQVRYGYANTLEEELEKMRYDLYYIKHRSLWLDLRIIGETIAVLVHPRTHDSTERRAGRAGWAETWPGTPSGVTLR